MLRFISRGNNFSYNIIIILKINKHGNNSNSKYILTMTAEIVEPKDSVAAKIFIRNIGHKGAIDKSVGVTIGVNAEPIGLLYGGDWMMMPLTCIDADDITANPATDDTVVLEYVMFYEEA